MGMHAPHHHHLKHQVQGCWLVIVYPASTCSTPACVLWYGCTCVIMFFINCIMWCWYWLLVLATGVGMYPTCALDMTHTHLDATLHLVHSRTTPPLLHNTLSNTSTTTSTTSTINACNCCIKSFISYTPSILCIRRRPLCCSPLCSTRCAGGGAAGGGGIEGRWGCLCRV